MSNDDVLVRCDGVTRTYGAGRAVVVAVADVSCEVRAGQRIAVVGPSGSGKSTLLHLLAGLDEPSAGTVTWPALGERAALRPGPVGIVFQSPSLLPPLDVVENVALPLLLAGVAPDVARAEAGRALELLGLGTLADKLSEEISGGQAQRVAVARALAGHSRLILADEPTGQLDHDAGALVIDVLLTAAAVTGAAVVVTTHDPMIAGRFDLTWSMIDGRRVDSESPACSS
jgi:putative ABC transport system ATP-binding protein